MKKVQMTNGETVLVDDEDLHVVSQFSWSAYTGAQNEMHKWDFPGTQVLVGRKRKLLSLHRLVMGAQWGDGRIVDHINGNTRDARKENLRFCQHAQNIQNQTKRKTKRTSSRFKGVYLHNISKSNWCKWTAQIRSNNVKYRLGTFTTEEEAAAAYNKAAIELHGQFANLNQL